MIAISAVDKNWAIGNQGKLLISLPEDQKGVFKKYTAGHTVVYGRKTLETFPGQRLLPNRVNIIMSRSFEYEPRIKNISSNEVKMVRGYSKTVISTDKSRIYAKPLDKSLKLFTEWDEERYYLGEPGDYIACRKDDEHDIYIIRGNLFPRLYKKAEE